MFKTSDMKRSSAKRYHGYIPASIMVMLCASPSGAFAAGPPIPSEISKPMAQVLILLIAVLALMIALLANVLNGAAQLFIEKHRKERKEKEQNASIKTLSLIFICFLSGSLSAAAEPAAAAAVSAGDSLIGGLAPTSFYALITVMGIELIILLALLYNLKLLLAKETVLRTAEAEAARPGSGWRKWWDQINSLRPIQEEANIDLGHDYDGIRELDNRLPPWWLYGFYLCIIVAGIYLYRYHIAHTAPLPQEELQIAMNKAETAKEEYLKKSANKVDENSVTYLSDAASLDAGKKIFIMICSACHVADGGGSVGPNLTDAYWLHGGSIRDIFKTIKYGWPDKGMKSWKDDYSPVQIAQIASYVKSLQGTKPAKPKEPQGTLYDEKTEAPAVASAKATAGKKITTAN